MHITPEHIEQTVDAILEVLEACGIPGAGLAQYALRGIKGLRQSAEAKAQLTALLQEAEAEFIQEAIKRGLGNAAGWVHDMPQHDRPAFQQALQSLLQHWDEGTLQQLLEREFAGRPGVSHGEAEAAALYMTILRTYLAHHPYFNRIITTTRILAIDQRTERIEDQLDTLHGAITVLLGMPADILGWPVEEPPAISELRPYLLHPKYRLIPYTGAPFEKARDDLVKWAQGLDAQEKKVGLRIYTAPGGAGKTRLLIEAGAALRRQGWWAGFLRQGRLDHKNARLLMADTRPTLLILDYAANRQAEAETLLTAAAEAVRERRRDAPLAVVFLERTSPDWLDQLLHRASDPSYVDWVEFLSLPGMERAPRAMPALQTPPERQAFFTTARERLVQYQPAPPPQPITYRAEELPASPLSLSLLALHAAGQRLDQPSDERKILRHTWQREREAWARCLGPWMDEQGVGWAKRAIIDYLERLQVLATLGRPFPDAPSLADFMGQHFDPIQSADGRELNLKMLAKQLPRVFPETAGALIPPIEPDPLADFVLWELLPEHEDLLRLALPAPDEAEAAPAQWAARIWRTYQVLARLWAGSAGPQRARVEGWVGRVTQALETLDAPPDFWAGLEGKLPRWSVLFRRLAVLVTERLLERTPADREAERARLLNNLANFWSDLGRPQEALPHAQEAAEAYRRLAETNPDAFLPDLAMSLTNLAVSYSELGRPQEALPHALEAVETYRRLAEANPDAFLPGLVMSLTNLAAFYSMLGRPQEALPLAQEALAIRRRLAEVNPDAFLPDLAMSLHNLAKFLSAQGRPQEALPLALEAVQTLAPFFAGLPRAFAKWMGGFLRNYLDLCAEVGAAPALDLPPAVREKLGAVTGNAGLPAEMRELAGRLLELCGASS